MLAPLQLTPAPCQLTHAPLLTQLSSTRDALSHQLTGDYVDDGESDNPMVEVMSAMFPTIEADVLGVMLSHHNGDIEAAVATLLDTVSPMDEKASARAAQLELDAEFAQRAQHDIDAEVAGALQKQLQEEEDQRKEHEFGSRAVAAVSSGAKSILHRVRSVGWKGRSDYTNQLLDPEFEVTLDPMMMGVEPVLEPVMQREAQLYLLPATQLPSLEAVAAHLVPADDAPSSSPVNQYAFEKATGPAVGTLI